MNEQDVLGAFLLVNNPIVLSEEETKDVQKAIKKLQQENKQLQERIEYLERSNNRREDTIFEQSQKISVLEDNWIELKEYIKNEIPEDVFIDTEWFVAILDKMKELEGSDSNGQ